MQIGVRFNGDRHQSYRRGILDELAEEKIHGI